MIGGLRILNQDLTLERSLLRTDIDHRSLEIYQISNAATHWDVDDDLGASDHIAEFFA